MLTFVHDRLAKLQRLLARSNATLTKYNALDLDLGVALSEFLDEAVEHYRASNRGDVENELLALKAFHTSAQHGVDPATLQRVTTHRRGMARGTALRVLQQSGQRLRADYGQDQQTLEEARTLLRPIVLQALHKGLIDVLSPAPLGQPQLEELWRTLLSDADTGLAARQVAMQLSGIDIQLLLAELITAAL